jgi:antigen flippase
MKYKILEKLKVGSYFFITSAVRLLLGLISVKIIALYAGPSGLGLVGQIASLLAMASLIAGGGIATGILKAVAQVKDNEKELIEKIGVASTISIVFSFICFILLNIFSKELSKVVFSSSTYTWVFHVLAFAQIFISISNNIQPIVNGFIRSDLFCYSSVGAAALGLLGLMFFCAVAGNKGVILGLIWAASCPALFYIVAFKYGLKLKYQFLQPIYIKKHFAEYVKYAVMAFSSACTLPLILMVIRNSMADKFGWEAVGFWQGAMRLSDAYLQVIIMMLGSYYLPKIAEKKTKADILVLLLNTYKIVLPALLFLGGGVYLFRDFVISIVFTPEFKNMREYMIWQFIGDFFKILAYVCGFIAVSKASMKLYISAELAQVGLFLCLSALAMPIFGPIGVVKAYALTYAIYFTLAVITTFLYFKYKK